MTIKDLVITVAGNTKVFVYAKPKKSKDAKFKELGVASALADVIDTLDIANDPIRTFTVSAGRVNVTLA